MNSKGVSLVEVLLSVAVFGLIVTGLFGGLIYGQQSTALAGQRARAVMLADEGLEAVRNIRDENFSNLSDGTYGLTTTGNQWNLSGSSDITDIFTRQVVISSVDSARKQVVATVTWQQNAQRTGSVTLTTYHTAWTNQVGGGAPAVSCGTYCQSLTNPLYVGGACRATTAICSANGEVYESGGDSFCTEGASADTCCCQP
ncbi:MAG: prepilin-type N-terminal cleavage/methylation domain-containing protein [Candidatus Daviesbacteria bacterium]|nr:prepilin-type N-terminal cleavage/methylation domain-containing protein [Candidatus Daviesbacteria bacterium]